MNKKIKLYSLLMLLACVIFSGCGKHVKKTTTYYSLIEEPQEYYIRLQSDGKYASSLSIRGTYEINNGVVTFHDEGGATTTGYIDGSYFLYQGFDGNDQRIPEEDSFEVSMYDGRRTTLAFHADNTVNYDIVQKGLYDFHMSGTYKREGNIITCDYVYRGQNYSHSYGIRDGIIYKAFSEDESLFDADAIATIEGVEKTVEKEKTSVLAVVLIVGILIVIVTVLMIAALSVRKNRSNDSKNSK